MAKTPHWIAIFFKKWPKMVKKSKFLISVQTPIKTFFEAFWAHGDLRKHPWRILRTPIGPQKWHPEVQEWEGDPNDQNTRAG